MAVNTVNKVIVNKLTKAQYDNAVANNEITSTQINEEIFHFTDDQFVSASDVSNWNNKSDFSGSYDDLTDKPTLQDLTNDVGFITKTVNNLDNYYTKTESYTKEEVNGLINGITTLNIQVVTALPTSNISSNTIYLVPKTPEQTNNKYDEYLYVNNKFEKIGDTEINLSNYALKTEIKTKTSELTNDSNFVSDSSYVHTDNNYSSTEKEKVSANTLARHSHSNKDVLDGTTASYTTAEKTKLSGIDTGAEANVIESVKVNGTALPVSSKAVDITIPEVPTVVTKIWS